MKHALSPLAALFFLPLLAHGAEGVTPLGNKSGDWESFTYNEKGGKVCYLASQPKRSVGASKSRGNVFFTVTNRTSDKSFGVVSIDAGFTYRKNADAELDIGGKRFTLYTTGGSAWSRDDKAVVAALLKGRTVIVHGTPAKGEPVADTYSLDGFPKALAAINKACGVR